MRCRDVERLVTLYIDGDLDDRRSSALRGHLRVCDPCQVLVEDEARIRDLAGSIEQAEPPAHLWAAIDARLAEEEIADGKKSRLALWGSRVVDATRRRMIPAVVVSAAAAALLLIWISRQAENDNSDRKPQSTAVVEPAEPGPSPEQLAAIEGPCASATTHNEQLLCQMDESDRRYLAAIEELETQLVLERGDWSDEARAEFDRTLTELEQRAEGEKRRLAASAEAPAAADRDALHAIYRQQIDLMSDAVLGMEMP